MHFAAGQGRAARATQEPAFRQGRQRLHRSASHHRDQGRPGARQCRLCLVLRSYLPVIGNTPADYLIFCGVANGRLDPSYGIPATPAVVEYLKGASKLAETDAPARLAYFFKHLDSSDAAIAADAFFEFARASDTEIMKSAKSLDAAKIRKLISDPKTPVERLGVFAFLLGATGGAADAAFLAPHAHRESALRTHPSRIRRTPRRLHPARAEGRLDLRGRRARRRQATLLHPTLGHQHGAVPTF